MRSKKPNIDVDTFIKLMFQTLNTSFPALTSLYSEASTRRYLELLFDRVDRKKSNSLKTTDIATALVLLCKTPPLEKLRLLFRVFDADDDSCLTPDEIFDMYYSIRKNDTSRAVSDLLADLVFDDELSLQAARRLYERTVANLRNITDFIIFEEFAQVFAKSPEILEQLVPGTFSMEWNMTEYRPSKVNPCSPALVKEIRDSYKRTLRRGCEGLKLDKVGGRGTRILQTIREMPIHWARPAQPAGARTVAPLPRLMLAKPEYSRDDDDSADDDDDDDEIRALIPVVATGQNFAERKDDAVMAKQSALSGLAEELKEPELPLMSINYPDGQTYRNLKYDHTQPPNPIISLTRRKPYTCVVCAQPHVLGDEAGMKFDPKTKKQLQEGLKKRTEALRGKS
jgi:Ca2+-binding EF-hand superfamily protein